MPALRPLLTFSAVLVAVFAIATFAGYVYEHDPERDLIEVVIDRSALPADDGEFASGTILSVDGNSAQIASSLGTFEVELDALALEELQPLENPAEVAAGAALNLGGERAATEPVISGVVVMAPEVTP